MCRGPGAVTREETGSPERGQQDALADTRRHGYVRAPGGDSCYSTWASVGIADLFQIKEKEHPRGYGFQKERLDNNTCPGCRKVLFFRHSVK